MGYKQGLGLGKGDQGMANPLTVERTSKTSCKILHEGTLARQFYNIFIIINIFFLILFILIVYMHNK